MLFARLFFTVLLAIVFVALTGVADLQTTLQEILARMKQRDDSQRATATRELIKLSLDPSNHGDIVNSEAFLLLIAQLQSENELVRILSMHTFGVLGGSKTSEQPIADAEIISEIVSHLGVASEEESMVVIQTIGNLAHSDAIQRQVGETGGIVKLAQYLHHHTEKVRRVTAGVLGNLAIHEPNCGRMAKAGVIGKLVALLDQTVNTEASTIETAVSALRNLLVDETLVDDLIDAGVIPALAQVRRSGSEEARETAANLMDFLAQEVAELPDAVGGDGNLDMGVAASSDDEL